MRGENDGLAEAPGAHALEVDLAIAEAEGGGRDGLVLAADGSLHAGHELTRAEGLGDVVVSAEFEEEHFVDDLGDSAEDDDGGLAG